MGTKTPIYGWPLPSLPDAADAPVGVSELAVAIEQAFIGQGTRLYVPTWVSQGKVQPVNPLTSQGRYRIRHGWCDVWVYMTFGPSTGGGTGVLSVGLPAPAHPSMPEQVLLCKTLVTGTGTAFGEAYVKASKTEAWPTFPTAFTTQAGFGWRSSIDPPAVNTGIPQVAGVYTVRNGGNFGMSGRYRVED